MNTLEDRLRATAQAVVDVIPAGSAPPLHLAGPQRRRCRGGRLRLSGRRGWADWIAPIGAAAAVVAVTAVSLAATHGWLRPGEAGAAAGPAGTPAYYVSVASSWHAGGDAAVKSTATGRTLARVSAPRPFSSFTLVTAAADDGTFVLAAQGAAAELRDMQRSPGLVRTQPIALNALAAASTTSATWATNLPGMAADDLQQQMTSRTTVTQFFMLRIDSAPSAPRLSALPVPLESQPVTGAALSPDGRKLAVALASPGQLTIQVITLATGSVRTWRGETWKTPSLQPDSHPSINTLSWTADDRMLAFDWQGPSTEKPGQHVPLDLSVSELSTNAPGSNLAADSIPVFPAGYLIHYPGNAIVAPDGKLIIGSPLSGLVPNVRPTDTQYSTHSPYTVRSLWNFTGSADRVLWTNATGSVLIIATGFGSRDGMVGVLTRRGLIPLRSLGVPYSALVANSGEIAW